MASLPDRPDGFGERDARISGWVQTQDRSGARGRAGPPRARRGRGGRALRRGDDALGGRGRRGRSDPRGGRGGAESPRRADRPPGAGRHLRAALSRRDLRSRLLDRRAPPHAGYGGGGGGRADLRARPQGGRSMSTPAPSISAVRSSLAGRYELAYRGLILFTILLYLRPNELLPIGTFPLVKILTIGTLAIFFLDKLGQGGPLSVMPQPFKYVLAIDALAIVSIPLGLDPAASFESFTDLFVKILLIFLLMINVVTSFRRLRFIIEVVVVSATIVGVMTLADFAQGENLVEYYLASGALGGMFANPNDLALAMNMLIPFAIYLGLMRRNPLMRFTYFVCAMLLGATAVVTYSRAGFLSMVIGGAFFLAKISRPYPAALAVGAAGALGLLATSPGRIFTIFAGGDGHTSPADSASARWDLIKRSFEAAGVNPFRGLFGVGVNNFHIVSNKELGNHNAYLQVFNEIGLPALCFYVLFLASVIAISARIVKRYRRARGYRQVWLMAVAIQTLLVVYLIGSFFASVAYLWYVYYPAAFPACLQQILRQGQRLPAQNGVEPRVWYLRRVQH